MVGLGPKPPLPRKGTGTYMDSFSASSGSSLWSVDQAVRYTQRARHPLPSRHILFELVMSRHQIPGCVKRRGSDGRICTTCRVFMLHRLSAELGFIAAWAVHETFDDSSERPSGVGALCWSCGATLRRQVLSDIVRVR